MKERLVKGTSLREVVRLLRAHQHTRPLPEVSAWEQDLLRKHVSPSTWYSLHVFDSLLQLVHRFVYDGSELAAHNMGRAFARAGLVQDEGSVTAAGNPAKTLERATMCWRSHYNFGEFSCESFEDEMGNQVAKLRVSGFPDMSATHGHAILGLSLELAEQAGARDVKQHVDERPWMHNSVLTYTLTWK